MFIIRIVIIIMTCVSVTCVCCAAADAKKCYATGRGIQPKGVRVAEDADFKIFTEGAGGGNGEPKVMIMAPGGTPEKFTLKKVENYYSCVYKPMKPGMYIVTIQYASQPIQKSPFKVDVAPVKTSKIRAFGPGLKTGMVGYPATFRVVPHGEPGQIGKQAAWLAFFMSPVRSYILHIVVLYVARTVLYSTHCCHIYTGESIAPTDPGLLKDLLLYITSVCD